MKMYSKRLFSALLAIIMVVSIMPNGIFKASATTAAPQNTYSTGDIYTFGSYPQTKVTDTALITALNTKSLQSDNTVTYDGSKYLRVYLTTANDYTNGYEIDTAYWFKFEPIQWRVLSYTNGELFVMSDKIFACKSYNQVNTDITWETCTMRSWLNNDFYNTAFDSTERAKIKISTVINENNPLNGTAGGNNTNDKLFLLSYTEAMTPAYSFSSNTTRVAQGTDFAKSQGLYVDWESCYWWLRSPGSDPGSAGVVGADGDVYTAGGSVHGTVFGVRPAFKINLIYSTGDSFAFGSYPQTKVTDTALITALDAQILQADSTVTYDGSKYKRVFFSQYTAYNGGGTSTDPNQTYQDDNNYFINTIYWFKFEPIQWRVLSNTNGELFVMADKILATKPYNQDDTDITWETCTMRAWLNNDFYDIAFTAKEQSKIETSTVINGNNPSYGTVGGNNTNDKLFLLSYNEAINPAYGFSSLIFSDTTRVAQGTDFAKSQGLYVNGENSTWWLRTPGYYQYFTCFVSTVGWVEVGGTGINRPIDGARPVFKINLESDIFSSKVGSNSRIDYVNNFIYGLAPGITSLVDYAEPVPGYNLEYVTTVNGFGTGTVVNVTLNGAIVESYTIVIFGDVNGDGIVDSIDAGTMVDYENYMVTWDPAVDAAFIKAGDLNGDGSIDSIDAGIAVDAENYLMFINQSTGIGAVIEPIEGSVFISGIPKYGNTLTADTTNITPAGVTLTYTWKRSGTIVGTDKTYEITTADIGKSITVTVTGVGAYSGGIRSLAVTPAKADVSAPLAPTLSIKTPNTVTLNAIIGQEYKIEGGEWQSNAVFTGLSSNTVYNFYTRVSETDTHYASGVSTALSVTTYEKDISGTVTIIGTAKYGEMLTADTSNIYPSVSTLSYQWKRGGVNIGNESTYTIAVEDIGQPITVTVTGTGVYEGSITCIEVIPSKADVSTPIAPSLKSKTFDSVTLNAVVGQEYKVNSGPWQTSGVFTGLNINTTYNFYTRISETATHNASASSTALSVTTNKAVISGTVTIFGNPKVGQTLSADISGVIPSGATVSYKWKAGTVQIGTNSTYTVLDADIGESITVTVTGIGDYMGSLTSPSVLVVD